MYALLDGCGYYVLYILFRYLTFILMCICIYITYINYIMNIMSLDEQLTSGTPPQTLSKHILLIFSHRILNQENIYIVILGVVSNFLQISCSNFLQISLYHMRQKTIHQKIYFSENITLINLLSYNYFQRIFPHKKKILNCKRLILYANIYTYIFNIYRQIT